MSETLLILQTGIQLEKQWDLYDLAQEFLSVRAQSLFQKPSEARPTKHSEELIEQDEDVNSDGDEDDADLHNLFDSE